MSRDSTFDRLPPQNIDAERSVLGAMLLSSDAVGTAIEILREDAANVFYVEAHQRIYEAMVALFRRNVPVDAVTLMEELARLGHEESSGGATYVGELITAVPTSANAEYYAQIVLDAAILRRVIRACTNLASEAYNVQGEVGEMLDRAESAIFSIAETRQLNEITKVSDLLAASVSRIEAIIKAHDGITGIPTGFKKLDEMLSGFQRSDMIVIAARPSVGKTAFALNIASHVAIRKNKSALIFSLEMSKEQLVQRLLCMEGKIDSRRLRTGFLATSEFPKLQHAADVLSRAPIFIDDTPNITALDVRSKARRHVAKHDLDLIIVDYMQLMASPRRTENRQVEIADISRSIKGLARELNIPVVALSQLSREAEKDDTGAPRLAHLRESGAIEQDADVVIMLSRPPAHEAENNENLIKVTIAKQRNGPTGALELLFERNIQQFRNLAADSGAHEPPPSGYDTDVDAEEFYKDEEEIPF